MTSRAPVAALAALALVAAGWGGLSRLGLVPAAPGDAAADHGALMVSSFIGTLIGLERAIVLRRSWAYLAPLLAAVAGVLVLAGAGAFAPPLVVASALAFVVVTAVGGPASPGIAVIVMSVGAAAWLAGAVLWWQGAAPFRAMPFWAGFLVLTIAAERMELARALRPSRAATGVLVVAASVFGAGLAVTLADLGVGLRVAGSGALVLSLWLAARDRPPAVARVRGLPRFIATAIPMAYGWLAVSALFMVAFDGVPAGWRYDAMVHALFAGFVLSMIFAHGPIVVPAVIGAAIRYAPSLYVPLALLEVSVFVRVAGDVLERADVRDAGAVGIAIAVPLFMLALALGMRVRRDASRRALREASS